jgi:hypothetical protein
MTIPILIAICGLLLLAYLFDISAARTRVPTAVLLLVLGFLVRQVSQFLPISIPDLQPALPILGTVGLILIVLEGSIELEMNRSRLPLVGKTALLALFPLLGLALGLAWFFQWMEPVSMKIALLNAIPVAIMSSAIAIPSVQHLSPGIRSFVTYETSLSDIFGVIVFNFIALNETFDAQAFQHFGLELLLMLAISAAATLGLAFLLSRIKHHVKNAPIILMIILIYAVAKLYHLPALLFILLLGLFLGNLDELLHLPLIRKIHPSGMKQEIASFSELTAEFTFLVRALFFLVFGFLIEAADVLNLQTLGLALLICLGIYVIRSLFLFLFRIPLLPYLWIAPRGLITILLFLSIPLEQTLPMAGKSLIIQVIVLSALVMMLGLMFFQEKESAEEKSENPEGADLPD